MSTVRRAKARPVRNSCRIDVIVDPSNAAAWNRAVRPLEASVRKAARAALKEMKLARGRSQLAVRLSGDRDVRRLNHDFRGKDKPTNVLSFPAGDELRPLGAPLMLGDIVIAYGTVAREAAAQGKPIRDHLLHLVVHGVLHLLGHDHQRPAEAARMERIETDILAGFGIPDPYVIERRRA
jgi:probable rRNA maturation factor